MKISVVIEVGKNEKHLTLHRIKEHLTLFGCKFYPKSFEVRELKSGRRKYKIVEWGRY